MIKGKAKCECGFGDVRTTAILSDGIGALCLESCEAREIGMQVPIVDDFDVSKSDIVFTFTNTKSVDVFIQNLQIVKQLMEGTHDPANLQELEQPLNLDSFMKEK